MKKIISTVVLCLILVSSALTLVSCGKLEDGRYVSSTGIAFEISGDTYTLADGNVKLYAKVDIKGDTFTLTYDKVEFVGDPADSDVFNEQKDVLIDYYKANVCKTYEYEKIEGGIKLDGVKFTKK